MKRNKKLLIAGLSTLIILIVILIIANLYVKKQIEEGLVTELGDSSVTYDDVSVNILSGNASLNNPVFSGGGFDIVGREIAIEDFSYSEYIFNGKIVIGHIIINEPNIVIDESQSDTTSTGSREEREQAKERNLRIKKISINGGSVKVIENDSVPNSFYLSINSLALDEVVYNEKTEEGLLPIVYEDIQIESDSLYFDLNTEHFLTAESLKHTDSDLNIENLRIVPKYNRVEFDKRIPYEKDRVELDINSLSFSNYELDTERDSLLLKSPDVRIDNADVLVYRNKLLPDDDRIKPLYSQMLRELGFKLQLENIKISNAKIVYEENVLESRPPGKLTFDDIEIEIKNLSNVNMESENFANTEVKAKALFMGESIFQFEWEFDISNTIDQFTIQGSLDGIAANSVNTFLKPAMNVEIEGEIESLFFNFYGNRNSASGDMQLAYRDFKVNILKEGEEQKKSFLSGIANLFLKNDAVNEDVQQEDINVDRDKTKSFWNYLWLCIRDGTLKTFL